MTPLECAARALAADIFPGPWEELGEGEQSVMRVQARLVIEAIREPIADASVYLQADAEAWEIGAKDAPHEVYLMECGRLRRSIAEKLDALLEEGR